MLDDVGLAVSVYSEDLFALRVCFIQPCPSFSGFNTRLRLFLWFFDVSVLLVATNAHSNFGCCWSQLFQRFRN